MEFYSNAMSASASGFKKIDRTNIKDGKKIELSTEAEEDLEESKLYYEKLKRFKIQARKQCNNFDYTITIVNFITLKLLALYIVPINCMF